MSKIKAIFWDCDGTITHSEDSFLKACRRVFRDYGIKITDKFFVEENFINNISVFELMKRAGYDDAEILKAREKRNVVYAEILKKEVAFAEGVQETLEYLKNKVTMGIVSNAYREHLDITMDELSLHNYFNFALSQEDVKRSKPDPESYILAVKKSAFAPGQCVAVEDNLRGVTAAKNAGIRCFLIPNRLTPDIVCDSADKIFTDANGLLAYLKNEL